MLDSPLSKRTLQGFVTVIKHPNFDANTNDIRLWVDPKSITIEVHRLPMCLPQISKQQRNYNHWK